MCECFTNEALDALRSDLAATLSPHRYAHTCGVEHMTARLARLFCPERERELRVAALLHDLTKEYSDEEQQAVLSANGVTLRSDEARAPKIWHAMTAAWEIPLRYPAFATPTVLAAVRWHTTGRAGMSTEEILVYLADLIEEGRDHPPLAALRRQFFGAAPEALSPEARMRLLHEVLQASLRATLLRLGEDACADTRAALEYENDFLKGK